MTLDHVHALPPGTRLEEYRLDAMLGAGGFGITYRAYDANLDKFVAIKEYLPKDFATRTEGNTVVPQSSTDAQDYHWGLNRFLDEARTLARFDHAHLNRVHRFFEANGTAYMVLEHIHGETLAVYLSHETRLSEQMLRRLLEEVLSGLAVVHEAGYVHRDIKPGNLMLRKEDGSAVVVDFGAARQAVGQRSRPITNILTPGYAPVEQYDSKADDVGPWSDIYALGMVAYRCISGLGDHELPDAVTRSRIQRKGQVDLTPAIEAGKGQYSPKLLEAIDWAMEVDEGDRPQTVEEWRRALAGGGRRKRPSRSAGKAETLQTGSATPARSGTSWSTAAMTVVILALLGTGAWWGWQEYPGLFGGATVEVTEVTEAVASAGTSGEALQEGEPAETGEAVTADSASGPPPPADTPQTAPAEVTAETAPVLTADEEGGATEGVEAESTRPEPGSEPPVEDDEVARLLAAAEADLEARRLTSPAGNNAWEKYQRVLSLSPAHPAAMAGMERVIESYMELFGAAVEQEEFDQAAGYLERIRGLHPDSPVLEAGGQRLEAAKQARADRLAEQERQRQAELERQRQVSLARESVGEMVSIPGGKFRMGDLIGEGDDDERPVHSVTVPGFRLGRYEVTVGQFRRFVEATGYRTDAETNAGDRAGCYTMEMEGRDKWDWTPRRHWGNLEYTVEDDQPVVCVSWNDVQSFIGWLNDKTGGDYRLPSEAEWEYAVRAETESKYHFGNDETQLCRYANVADNTELPGDKSWVNKTDCSDGSVYPAKVGTYSPNDFGLYDMHGNVWEWVQDCWNKSYAGAPDDGSAWMQGDCSLRVVRGGSWSHGPRVLRSAYRDWSGLSDRDASLGFRLAQDN